MQATEEAVAEALGSSAEGGAAEKGGLGGSTSMPNGIGIRGSQASVASLWSEHALAFFVCCLTILEMPFCMI